MCVRTIVGGEEVGVGEQIDLIPAKITEAEPEEERGGNKLTKAKEYYMKQHSDMLVREAAIARDNKISRTCDPPEMITNDIVAKLTCYYCQFLGLLSKIKQMWKHTKTYKILFYTTQPAHVIMIAAVLCVTSALVPNTERTSAAGQPHSRLTSFIYLTSFITHIGAQIWMTFVSGLSLYFALPRHTFGEVQRVLFPRYFSLNACLSLVTLLIFVKHHPTNTWDAEIAIQVGAMSTAFFLELLIRLYLTPPLLRLITHKTALERAAGVGTEIGRHNLGPLKHCPHYLNIHHAFRRVHVSIAMGNMVTMACTVLHLHYIASKLCVL